MEHTNIRENVTSECPLLPFSLLEVHHRGGHEESVTTSGRPDSCNIKVRSTGVGHLNGLIRVARAWLCPYEPGIKVEKALAHLRLFFDTTHMLAKRLRIGHERHSRG